MRQLESQNPNPGNCGRTGSPSDLFDPLNKNNGKNDSPNSEATCTLCNLHDKGAKFRAVQNEELDKAKFFCFLTVFY